MKTPKSPRFWLTKFELFSLLALWPYMEIDEKQLEIDFYECLEVVENK